MSSTIALISQKGAVKYIFYSLVFISVVLGVFLRIVSYKWNDKLNGDVNLFALTAREFVSSNRLYYPMKYEFSDNVAYLDLSSPATQHPPLWPFVAGLLGKLFSTDETYTILKLMSAMVGISLMAMIAYSGFRGGWLTESLLAIIVIALSPMLVDFSANGSPYILSALYMTLAFILLRSFDRQKLSHYIYAGILCGVSSLTHSNLIFLVAIFLVFSLWYPKGIYWKGILFYFLSMFLVLSPWIVWNMIHFGKPFYSYSSFHFYKTLGMARMGIFGNVLTTRMGSSFDLAIARNYLSIIEENIDKFSNSFYSEIGLVCFILSAFGILSIFKQDSRKASAIVYSIILYTIVIFLWPDFKIRFLVPVMPLIYIAAAFGITAVYQKKHIIWKVIAVLLFLGMIASGLPDYFEKEPTRYYEDALGHSEKYSQMKALAQELQNFEPAVVLGYAETLDGGIDTIYYHRFPFVHGRDFPPDLLIKLVRDFDIRYIWTDTELVDAVRTEIPQANLILHNDLYFVFEVPKD